MHGSSIRSHSRGGSVGERPFLAGDSRQVTSGESHRHGFFPSEPRGPLVAAAGTARRRTGRNTLVRFLVIDNSLRLLYDNRSMNADRPTRMRIRRAVTGRRALALSVLHVVIVRGAACASVAQRPILRLP